MQFTNKTYDSLNLQKWLLPIRKEIKSADASFMTRTVAARRDTEKNVKTVNDRAKPLVVAQICANLWKAC